MVFVASAKTLDWCHCRAKTLGNYYCTQCRTALFFVSRLFCAHDQAVASLFRQRMTPPADLNGNPLGDCALCASFYLHQQGRHDRGPYLEAECTGCVRRVCFCWCCVAGSILSSRGRRRGQTIDQTIRTGEETSPVFVFHQTETERTRRIQIG